MSLSEKVLERVAAAENTEPSELEKSLFEMVDPDALDSIFESFEDGPERDAGKIQFPYHGYKLTVTADGTVKLRDEP